MDRAQNGSNSRERRHFTPQQKVAIVKAHLVDGVPISDLCDRHHIQPAQFYLWQKQLFENGATAFERKTKASGPDAGRASGRSAAGQAGHQERGHRRADGGERQLKKTRWPALKGRWVTHDVRDEVVDYVGKWSGRTELPATRLVKWIGVGMSKFYDWRARYGKVNEHNRLVPRDHWLEAWEREAILTFYREHPLEDARQLVAGFVEHYNHVRLHSAIGYVTPADKLAGRETQTFAERDRKLAPARERRAQQRRLAVTTNSLHQSTSGTEKRVEGAWGRGASSPPIPETSAAQPLHLFNTNEPTNRLSTR